MTGIAAVVVAYSCQVAVLVFAAWLALILGRVRAPRLRLLHYEATLVAAVVLLPCLAFADLSIAPPAAVMFNAPQVFAVTTVGADVHPTLLIGPWTIVGVVLVGGMAVRATWLAMGLLRLRRIRMAARELHPLPHAVVTLQATLGLRARWFVTDAVAAAATYGVRSPVVLLPSADLQRDDAALRAIACHELRHVARCDWLRTMAEEVIRTALWFHPAIWFLVDRIRLCREQVVDADVIAMTGDRLGYAEALIESAATMSNPPLAPAWLHGRHLRIRIASIAAATGGPMSRTRFVSSAVVLVVVLAAACTWTACAFPSHDDAGAASPTAVAPTSPAARSSAASRAVTPADAAQPASRPSAYTIGNGVIPPRMLSMVKPSYTPDAMKAKISGDVWIEGVVDAHGAPNDLHVTRSLDRVYGLDQEALKAAGQWRFAPGMLNGSAVPVKVTLVMNFRLR